MNLPDKCPFFMWDVGRGVEVNLNQLAERDFCDPDDNPLLKPETCQEWLTKIEKEYSVGYTWGGYLEDRSWLWRNSYLSADRAIHLGVDINVFGTVNNPIVCPIRYRIADVFHDTDQNGGWGTRITVETERGFCVFAHVAMKEWFIANSNQWFAANTDLCYLANSAHNGGWFVHLHLQGLRSLEQLEGLDGYGRDTPMNRYNYPHPFYVLGLQDAP